MGLLNFFKRPKKTGIHLAGGSGASLAQAIAIRGVPNGIFGVAIEYQILDRLFGRRDIDWKLDLQMLDEHDGRHYDILTVILASGGKRRVFFDITDFYAKGTAALLTQLVPELGEVLYGPSKAAAREESPAREGTSDSEAGRAHY
jgi:hypothetical protein